MCFYLVLISDKILIRDNNYLSNQFPFLKKLYDEKDNLEQKNLVSNCNLEIQNLKNKISRRLKHYNFPCYILFEGEEISHYDDRLFTVKEYFSRVEVNIPESILAIRKVGQIYSDFYIKSLSSKTIDNIINSFNNFKNNKPKVLVKHDNIIDVPKSLF